MGKLVRFQRADLCSFGSGGHYNLQVMWKQMDREIPEGNIDLYILCTAYKWHPYAVKTLPITSPLTRICVLVTCRTRTCLLCSRTSLPTQISVYLQEVQLFSSLVVTIYDINATFNDMFTVRVHNAIIWPWFTVQLPISGEAWKMGSGIIQARLGQISSLVRCQFREITKLVCFISTAPG